MSRTTSFPCPYCHKKGFESWVRLIPKGTFLCPKCGSNITEKQAKDEFKIISELKVAAIYVKEANSRFNETFEEPVHGENPPDATSKNKCDEILNIEITTFDPNSTGKLLKNKFIEGVVDPLKSLIETILKKRDKMYDPEFKKKLVLLLDGDAISDEYFEDYEKNFSDLVGNRNSLKNLGFKEIWYITNAKGRAYKIY